MFCKSLKTFIQPVLIAFGVVLVLAPGVATQAQQNDEGVIEEIVTIGTPGGAGIEKRDVSFAISVLSEDEIAKFAPKSTADLLKAIPGVWVESSGGVSGANIDVRGLPGGGDAPFVTLTMNGTPLYGTESLSFFEQSTIFRVDETIASAEGLRGGPGAVFGKGEPGLTVNFNLKRGHEETEGRVKYTTSDYELMRFDGMLSGQLAEDLYYMIGGYVQSSPGIRDAQFTSEEGHQFTINLTKEFDQGEISLFSRVTDDHGQWYLPFCQNCGHDLGDFSQLGTATRMREIQISPSGDTKVYDFSNGRGWDGTVSGANIEFDFGNGWTLRDNVGLTVGDADTFGFVPSGAAITVADLEAVVGAGSVVTAGGETLSSGDYVQTYGHWVVMKELQSFTNDLSINKEFDGGHDVTFGFYQSSFSSDDFWSLGNPIPVHNTANGDFLDSSITPADIAAAGGDAGFMFGLASAGDARTSAFYVADSWQMTDAFRLDAGFRQESIELEYTLDTGPGYPDGSRDSATSLDDDQSAYTLGANWDFNEDLGFFGRYSKGYVFPHFDNVREGQLEVNDVEQIEFGVKFVSDTFDVFATAFFNNFDAFSGLVGGGPPPERFETDATGIEIDATAAFGMFNIGISGVFQNAEITQSLIEDPGNPGSFIPSGNKGNKVLRQPDMQFRISPSVDFELGTWVGTAYGAVTLVDDRFGDNANQQPLPSYTKVDLGVILTSDTGFFVQLHGDNIGDSHGFTEGDPRSSAAVNSRPIFGRSVRLSVGYDF
ncbi:MAG: TonB-dependent receptor [Gammaproteobacteria bacterium]|nr:TonB-dependent receptor [Gammaproteobacteria bacterium]MDH5304312.1 TonB-dependent receptor [Gammaproteobacteria bacterium]MDH5322583.1 TonB-dependent receptor [Gammaproteobacteria bacterium]